MLSSAEGAVSPPSVNTGSSTVIVFELTVVVSPITLRLPYTTTLPVGEPEPVLPGSRYRSPDVVAIVLSSIFTLFSVQPEAVSILP